MCQDKIECVAFAIYAPLKSNQCLQREAVAADHRRASPKSAGGTTPDRDESPNQDFVTRAKSNTDLRRIYSAPSDRAQGIICDQTVALSGFYSQKHFPHHLRRIRFKDPETGKTLIFLTNLFGPPPNTICDLYRARWQVELFFKWIKQHLRIKKFYGTSENAVKVQIWTAVSVYVLVAIIKKRLDLQPSLYTLLQVFSVTLFEKIPLTKELLDTKPLVEDGMVANQLNLFENSTGQ